MDIIKSDTEDSMWLLHFESWYCHAVMASIRTEPLLMFIVPSFVHYSHQTTAVDCRYDHNQLTAITAGR